MCIACNWSAMLGAAATTSLAAAIHANAARATLPRRRLLQAGALMAAAAVTPSVLQTGTAHAGPGPTGGAEGPVDWLFSGGGIYTMNPVPALGAGRGRARQPDRVRG
jgi:hypothetical protein